MNKPLRDDQIIAVAFRRSILVLSVVAAAALAAVLLLRSGSSPEELSDATPVAPQPSAVRGAPLPPAITFTDVTALSGIDFSHTNGAYGESLLPEAMGGGVAFLDYNDDGNTDLLFVSGRSWPWRDGSADPSSLRLYRGDSSWRFEDVTTETGLDTSLYGMGAAVGDYDGDGDVDLFITATGNNRLYRNDDGKRFTDVTAQAGVAGDESAWSSGAAFTDYDRDGDLDLFVVNYVTWSREIDLAADYRLTGIGRAYGPPEQFAGSYSYLYRNDGGSFTDVSASAGIRVDNPATGRPLGKGLALLPGDINGDGWPDFVIANDTVRNFLFLNDQRGGFKEAAVEYGLAFDNTGAATGAMGIDSVSLGEGREQVIAIGNFGSEMTSLYVLAAGMRMFTDEAVVTGVGPASRRAVTFGLFFFDYDLDGRPDLLQANGHVEDQIAVVEPGQSYEQPPQLFWNCGERCARQFLPVPLQGDLATPIVGRGAAYADVDRDGDLDVVLTQVGAPPVLLRNDQATGHHWLQVDVRDAAGAPALGALVEVVVDGRRRRLRVDTSRSYLSQVESVVTVGLGTAQRVDALSVTWPDGHVSRQENPAVDSRVQLKH